MTIPEEFYEAEVRDGFYVPSEMKRYWAVMLEVYDQVARVCRKHGLNFYADYGTLIGAVRHGGFIPWDDDFDISMMREDYMTFLKIAEKELPEGYKVLSIYNNHKSHTFLGRVVNMEFISTEAQFLKANHNCPYAAGIDIFPIDHFDYDESINEYQKILIAGFDEMTALIDEDEKDLNNLPQKIQERIHYLCDTCGVKLEKDGYLKQQMLISSDRLYSIFKKDSPYVAHMYFWEKYNTQVYPKEYYENTVMLPFECSYIPVPIAYDRILSKCYGSGYINPVRSGGVHDYPLYSIQREYMREAVGKVYYPEYVFRTDDLKRPEVEEVKRNRREMVFLPFSPKYWKYLEKEWLKYCNLPEWDVYVIPIPYYRKKEYGEMGELCYEIEGYPEYVALTGFDAYDFDNRIPDRIVIQNPYDEYDNAITVHPRFYTGLLRQVTKELVYIPYFVTDNFDESDTRSVITSSYYIKVPGVTRADKVILQSELIRRRYIDELTQFAGEETQLVWEERITADETILPDEECIGLYEDEVPGEWWRYLLDESNEGKKVLLYHVNAGNIVIYKNRYFEKMNRVFDIIKQNSDKISVFWHLNSGTIKLLESDYPDMYTRLTEIIETFKKYDIGIIQEGDETTKLEAVADAYFGDRDAVMYRVMKLGKPVMIQNVEI